MSLVLESGKNPSESDSENDDEEYDELVDDWLNEYSDTTLGEIRRLAEMEDGTTEASDDSVDRDDASDSDVSEV